MTELNLELDTRAVNSLEALMKHFKMHTKADVIRKAVAFLELIAYVDKSHGDLYVKKDGNETKINLN